MSSIHAESKSKLVVLLNQKFDLLQAKNSSYSLRAFAKKLDINPSGLSLILRGKRNVSITMANQLLDKLGIENSIKQDVLRIEEEITEHREMSKEILQVLSEWYYDALLELIKLKDFKTDLNWISDALDLPIDTIDEALSRLERLNMIDRSGSEWKVLEFGYNFNSNVFTNAALKQYQRNALNNSKKALDSLDIKKRFHSTQVLSFDTNRLEEAKNYIRDFKLDFDKKFVTNIGNQVFQFQLSFFPLTHMAGKDDK